MICGGPGAGAGDGDGDGDVRLRSRYEEEDWFCEGNRAIHVVDLRVSIVKPDNRRGVCCPRLEAKDDFRHCYFEIVIVCYALRCVIIDNFAHQMWSCGLVVLRDHGMVPGQVGQFVNKDSVNIRGRSPFEDDTYFSRDDSFLTTPQKQ